MALTILTIVVFLMASVITALLISNVKLWIELEAMKKSTHQFVMVDPVKEALKEMGEVSEFSSFTEETKENLKKSQNLDYDNLN